MNSENQSDNETYDLAAVDEYEYVPFGHIKYDQYEKNIGNKYYPTAREYHSNSNFNFDYYEDICSNKNYLPTAGVNLQNSKDCALDNNVIEKNPSNSYELPSESSEHQPGNNQTVHYDTIKLRYIKNKILIDLICSPKSVPFLTALSEEKLTALNVSTNNFPTTFIAIKEKIENSDFKSAEMACDAIFWILDHCELYRGDRNKIIKSAKALRKTVENKLNKMIAEVSKIEEKIKKRANKILLKSHKRKNAANKVVNESINKDVVPKVRRPYKKRKISNNSILEELKTEPYEVFQFMQHDMKATTHYDCSKLLSNKPIKTLNGIVRKDFPQPSSPHYSVMPKKFIETRNEEVDSFLKVPPGFAINLGIEHVRFAVNEVSGHWYIKDEIVLTKKLIAKVNSDECCSVTTACINNTLN